MPADDETEPGDDAFIEADLETFSIYRPHKAINRAVARKVTGPTKVNKVEKTLSNEFVSLHEINDRGEKYWFFDGVICYGNQRRYLQRIPFEILSIGGYEDTSLHTIGSDIWIQSIQSQKADIWYRLKSPAPEYKRYHEPFLWLADLSKHTIDFLKNNRKVMLHQFKCHFYRWLQQFHGHDLTFQNWFRVYNDTDFTRVIAAHSAFLLNQAVQTNRSYESHPLWGEIDWVALDAVPGQAKTHASTVSACQMKVEKTVVTKYVLDCFKHLAWAKLLEPHPMAPNVFRNHSQRVNEFHQKTYSRSLGNGQAYDFCSLKTLNKVAISVGDVVAINTDSATDWKTDDQLWYGYVQGMKETRKGEALEIIWLYRPSDTACQKMRYPYSKELFMSDHCNCGDHHILVTEVVCKLNVAFFAGSEAEADFFVRQKYVGEEAAWVTLQQSDFCCSCKTETKTKDYQVGDTLLVAISSGRSKRILEPVELFEKAVDGRDDAVRARRLLRKGRHFGDMSAEPNELVYTDIIETIKLDDISRSCHVRFYTEEDKQNGMIPVQYRRQGAGDFYYITCKLLQNSDTSLVPMSKPWPGSFIQGWDPSVVSATKVMRGLDIFCGGGNLGRGLEEGGAVKFEWAVDYFKEAIHTYRANLKDLNDTNLYCGSVNDYLRQAMDGSQSKLVAAVDNVDVISAGSPCQGFSNANQRRGDDQSLLNVSMVASVVSFVDFYRPKYAVLENVTGMAKCGTKTSGDNNVFAQVLCALVGLGYQVKPFILDAWNFGSPQSRTRLFISIAAPGLTPLPRPPHSHSHPDKVARRSLGKTANGLTLGIRYWDLTPFEYVTIEEATKDLPKNHDGRVTNIRFPDHRPSRHMSMIDRIRISCIPRFPAGMNFVKASMLGLMPEPQMEAFNWGAGKRVHPEMRAWKRVLPNALIATVTTACRPEDGFCGACIHWDACRCMTVLEVRRAQGFPDEEVIVGSPRAQWKIVGNSVARQVALALGMVLRTASIQNAENSTRVTDLSFEATISVVAQTTIPSGNQIRPNPESSPPENKFLSTATPTVRKPTPSVPSSKKRPRSLSPPPRPSWYNHRSPNKHFSTPHHNNSPQPMPSSNHDSIPKVPHPTSTIKSRSTNELETVNRGLKMLWEGRIADFV